MSEYKTLCYALQCAVRAAKLRYREIIESHFQLNDSQRMWQGLKTICSSGNKSSAEVRADPLLAEELNTFYGHFDCNGGSATLPISASGSSRQSSDDHVITVLENEVRRELLHWRRDRPLKRLSSQIRTSYSNQLADSVLPCGYPVRSKKALLEEQISTQRCCKCHAFIVRRVGTSELTSASACLRTSLLAHCYRMEGEGRAIRPSHAEPHLHSLDAPTRRWTGGFSAALYGFARTPPRNDDSGLCISPGPLEGPLLTKAGRDLRHGAQKEGCHDRRFQQGLGSVVRGQTNLRSLVRTGVGPAHQLPRNASSVSGLSILPAGHTGTCASSLRQQVRGVIHKSPGRPRLEATLHAGEWPSCVKKLSTL